MGGYIQSQHAYFGGKNEGQGIGLRYWINREESKF